MSTTDRRGCKIVLPRIGPEDFWLAVESQFAQADARKWKSLAMLALRVNAGWSLDMIGNAFHHDRGHVSRMLKEVCRELRETFEWIPEVEDDGVASAVLSPRPRLGEES